MRRAIVALLLPALVPCVVSAQTYDPQGRLAVVSREAPLLANGTITAVSQSVSVSAPTYGKSTVGIQISGVWSGQLEFEYTVDGSNYISHDTQAQDGTFTNVTSSNGVFVAQAAGFLAFRVRSSSWTSGTATVYLRSTLGTHIVNVAPGDGTIGRVKITDGSDVASVTAASRLEVDGSGVTQPVSGNVSASVSGTVTANQGTAAAWSGPWPIIITDGTNATQVTADAAVKTDLHSIATYPTQTAGVNGLLAVGGASPSGFGKSGYPVQVGHIFNTTQPTVTTGQIVEAQATARGGLIVATGVDTFNVTATGTVTANQGGAPWSQNVTQFGGTNVSTGTGAGGAGIPRVTISNDSSLAANQSVNLNQLGGVAPNLNAGDTTTGTQRVVEGGAPNLATGQVSCGATATSITGARAGRRSIGVTQTGTTVVYIGFTSGVTTANGDYLAGVAGAFAGYPTSGALWCIVASGSQTVTFAEVY